MKKLISSIVLVSTVFATESEILTPLKQQILKAKKENVFNTELYNKTSLLGGITLSGTSTTDQDDYTTNKFAISYSQDLFQFGGLWFSYSYANSYSQYQELGIDVTESGYLKSAYTTALSMLINDLTIEQTQLRIENAKIEIKTKTDLYKVGQADISDLNNAIMSKNSYFGTLLDLKQSKITYLATLKEYTNLSYKEITFPNIELIDKDKYIASSLSILQQQAYADTLRYTKYVNTTSLFPKLSFTYSYANTDYENPSYSSSNGDSYSYMFTLSMPINISSYINRTKSSVESLIAEEQLEDERISEQLAYELSENNIKNYQEKLKLAQEDVELYTTMVELTSKEVEGGFKSSLDLETLQNTKRIRELDIQINELKIKKELISLYYGIKR